MKQQARLFFYLLGASLGASSILVGCASRQTQPIWNVPALMGRPIEEVKSVLGAPTSESDQGDQTQSSWHKDGSTLRVSSKKASHRVTTFEVISRDDGEGLREGETSPLLKVGSLKENDPAYRVEWIEASDRPLFYIGARAVPVTKNHKVVLKAEGSSALVNIAYAVTGPGGKSETFMTIPPWEATFDLPDDSHVTFAATLYKRVDKTPFELKLEIEVDGKSVRSSQAVAGGAQCELDL